MPSHLRGRSVLCAPFLTLALSVPVAAQNPQDACACIDTWQTTVLAKRSLETCKEVRGSACLGYEVRVTKPWTWDAARKVCVGSFEYWQGVKGYKPEWQSAGRYENETVPLEKALTRCAEIGRTPADDPPRSAEPSGPTGAADRIRDAVRQAMRDRPSLRQATRSLAGDDYLIASAGQGSWSLVTASGSRTVEPFPTREGPGVLSGPVVDQAMRALGVTTPPGGLPRKSGADDCRLGGRERDVRPVGLPVPPVFDRYALSTADGFDVNMLGVTFAVWPDESAWRAALGAAPDGAYGIQRVAHRSSEHFSIKGTINGGGCFIAAPAHERPLHPLPVAWRPALATPDGSDGRFQIVRRISPPGADYRLAESMAVVEIGPSGVSAIAVLSGRATAVESETRQSREVGSGQMAVVVPGVGVSPARLMPADVRAFAEGMLRGSGPRSTSGDRPGRSGADENPSGSHLLKGGEEWQFRTSGGTLALRGRLPWKRAAGGANGLEVRVNGELLTGRLGNKAMTFSYADGREFSYLDQARGHWMVFYSPDLTANNTGAAGDYQVVTDPGEAYRYVWDITRWTAGGREADVRIRNPITTAEVSLEVSVDTPERQSIVRPEILAQPDPPGPSPAPERSRGGLLGRLLSRPALGETEAPARGGATAADGNAELTGTWKMDYWVFGRPAPREVTLEQRGPVVTGTMLSAGGNPIRVEGMVRGTTLALDFVYDNVAALSELTSPAAARAIAGIRSHAEFRRDSADRWTGTLSVFSLSTSGDTVTKKANGGTPGGQPPGPSTMTRVR